MHVVLAANQRSGRGRGLQVARALTDALRGAGHVVNTVAIGQPAASLLARGLLTHADLLVIAGGDGTLNRLAEPAARYATPVYHAPLGTENLIAREFGMDLRPETLLAAIERWQVAHVDLARANDRSFLIMASLGPDASVIHRLDRIRTRTIGHAAYVYPTLVEVLRPTFPRFSAEVDGREVVRDARGLLVVSNCRRYAMNVNPSPNARMDDGLLDLAFFPCSTSAGAALWGLRSRVRLAARSRNAVIARGREIVIRPASGTNLVYQIDGEAPGEGARTDELRLTLEPNALPILLPVATTAPVRAHPGPKQGRHDAGDQPLRVEIPERSETTSPAHTTILTGESPNECATSRSSS
ncbi:MAG: diacylglycerol kinase family protein [Phycisphaerales bacterium]|jgi:diacylglycerol kinase family enzyme|nr:diacylglycerol kinase family protein [Phycisphaerales bacterium]